MAIKTLWPVGHSCGHTQDHDLSGKRPSERAGYANWLGTKECTDCGRAGRDQRTERDKEAWLAQRRTEEAAAIETWEQRCAMPALDGSQKAVAWARRVRYQLVVGGAEHAETAGMSVDDYLAQLEPALYKVTSASWWIDQRDSASEDLAELVEDAASDTKLDTGTENPFS